MERIRWRDWLLIPNLLTTLRIFSIFPALYAIDTKAVFFVLILMGFLFLTDFLDGALARRFNQVSLLGSILDPVADKLVVLSLFGYYYFDGAVPWMYWILILTRDLAQLAAVPILLFWKKIQFKVKPKWIPKWGTALNFLILSLVMIGDLFPDWKGDREIWEFGLTGLYTVSGIVEVYILVTFIPRFYEIYTGRHDTFE